MSRPVEEAHKDGTTPRTREADHHFTRRSRPVSRPKVKCLFGPRATLRQIVRARPGTSDVIDTGQPFPSSSPGHDHLHEPPEVSRPSIKSELPPLPPAMHFNVDRVTFTHPQAERRTPFDRYRASCTPAPAPNSFLFAARRLGISAEELDAAVTLEIDDLLKEIETTRRQELLERLPFERRLSKDDCLRMFRNGDIPATGALAGVFRWATRVDLEDDPNLLNVND